MFGVGVYNITMSSSHSAKFFNTHHRQEDNRTARKELERLAREQLRQSFAADARRAYEYFKMTNAFYYLAWFMAVASISYGGLGMYYGW